MKYILCVLFIGALSCSHRPDFEAEKAAIMLLHKAQRQAHFEKNVSLLFKDSLTDYVEINRGLVKKPTLEDSKKKFQAYFDSVDFIKWDDVSEPLFSFSDDATMATTVVEKEVITKGKSGDSPLDTTYFAWMAVYKKHHGQWRLHRMASTNR